MRRAAIVTGFLLFGIMLFPYEDLTHQKLTSRTGVRSSVLVT